MMLARANAIGGKGALLMNDAIMFFKHIYKRLPPPRKQQLIMGCLIGIMFVMNVDEDVAYETFKNEFLPKLVTEAVH